ncbi:hypothetical protein OHA72_38315 [Dactylosporangium sp. NBC_01737]|uniref:hypothetical protein n=1 Tax=Dactylosporangium sp. NBC_01737 TaxID=2975959 RepID=UPI002E0EB9B0|nr:hypothetical protein OHA72_38315 [Dactylosporangium sp. NBC_01737]
MDLAGRALVAATRDPEFWRCYAFDGDGGFDFVAVGERLARRLNDIDVDDDDWDDEDEDDLSSARAILPARRGWLLSGEYAGYSIRNDCHSRFPFPEFTEFRRQLAVADGPGGQF